MACGEIELKRCEKALVQYLERRRTPATYEQTKKLWKIYWMHQDLKWHGYKPTPEVKNLEAFLDVVDRDEHGCFFG